MQAVVDGGNSTHHRARSPRQHQLHVRVGEERILRRIQPLVFADAQRRDPMRIAGVALVHVVHETPKLSASSNRSYLDRPAHASVNGMRWGIVSSVRSFEWIACGYF